MTWYMHVDEYYAVVIEGEIIEWCRKQENLKEIT